MGQEVKRLILLIVFAVLACRAHPDLDAERAAIAAADSAWLAMSSTDDVDSIVSFWTEGARVIAPGQPPIIGRPAIRQMVDESLRIPGFSINWHTTDVIVAPSGDVGYSFATNVFTLPEEDGKVDTLRGQGVVIWRKGADRRWRADVDIWTPQSR